MSIVFKLFFSGKSFSLDKTVVTLKHQKHISIKLLFLINNNGVKLISQNSVLGKERTTYLVRNWTTIVASKLLITSEGEEIKTLLLLSENTLFEVESVWEKVWTCYRVLQWFCSVSVGAYPIARSHFYMRGSEESSLYTEKTIFIFPFTMNGIWLWWQFSLRFWTK